MKRNKHLQVTGDIKDRGKTKWQGLMLPEHQQLIQEWYEEDDQIAKPDLTEEDMQLIQEELELAMTRKCEVLIKSWKDNKIHYHQGTIEEMDSQSRTIVYDDPFGLSRLPVDEIVAVLMID